MSQPGVDCAGGVEGKGDYNLTLKAQAVTCSGLAPRPQPQPLPQTQNREKEREAGRVFRVSICFDSADLSCKLNQSATLRKEAVGRLQVPELCLICWVGGKGFTGQAEPPRDKGRAQKVKGPEGSWPPDVPGTSGYQEEHVGQRPWAAWTLWSVDREAGDKHSHPNNLVN